MNATVCKHVTQFSLNYTTEICNDLCALSQNSKTIYCMEKLKLSLDLKRKALSIKRKITIIQQIIREIEANECNRL